MNTVKYSIIFVVALSFSSPSWASENCSLALIQDRSEINLKESNSLATVNHFRRNFSRNDDWKGELNLPIKGLPIEANGSNSKSILEDVVRSFNQQFEIYKEYSLITQGLSENALRAYRDCLKLKDNKHGLKLISFDTTKEAVTSKVTWVSPPKAPTEATVKIEIKQGNKLEIITRKMKTGEQFSFTIDREKGKDTRIIVNGGGYSVSEIVYWVPDVEINYERKTVHINGPRRNNEWRLANDGTGGERSISDICSEAPAGWRVIPSTASTNIRIIAGKVDKRKTWVKFTKRDESQVCFSARMYPITRKGGDMWWRPKYEIERVTVTLQKLSK